MQPELKVESRVENNSKADEQLDGTLRREGGPLLLVGDYEYNPEDGSDDGSDGAAMDEGDAAAPLLNEMQRTEKLSTAMQKSRTRPRPRRQQRTRQAATK